MAHKLQVVSFVRGYHAYMDIWLPSIDDELCLKRELSNKEDANAVAVVRDGSLKCEKNVKRMSKHVKTQSNFVICPPK